MLRTFPKPTPYRNADYLQWTRLDECAVKNNECAGVVEASHSGAHGLGTKASDLRTLPLCIHHHRGPRGLDRIGPENFERQHNINIREIQLERINRYLAEGHTL